MDVVHKLKIIKRKGFEKSKQPYGTLYIKDNILDINIQLYIFLFFFLHCGIIMCNYKNIISIANDTNKFTFNIKF